MDINMDLSMLDSLQHEDEMVCYLYSAQTKHIRKITPQLAFARFETFNLGLYNQAFSTSHPKMHVILRVVSGP